MYRYPATGQLNHLLFKVFYLVGLCLLSSTILAEQRELQDKDLSIVGVMINGVSETDWDIYTVDNEFWLSEKDLEQYFQLSLSKNASSQFFVESPLGNVNIALTDTAEHRQSGTYLSTKTLRNKLGIRSEFIHETYTLSFEVPWNSNNAGKNTGKNNKQQEIDYYAPAGTLGAIYLENNFRLDQSTMSSQSDSQLLATGSAGSGLWLLSFAETSDEQVIPENYHWTANSRHSILRIGTSQANISPLISQIDFTGLQYAWSNSDIDKYAENVDSLNLNGFISDDIDLLRTIKRSDGHPAGIAVLKINGYRVAAVRIGLDGQYEFSDIEYDADHYQDVSIHIYESTAARKPVNVISLSRHTTGRMLDRGEQFLRFGFGSSGNAATRENEGQEQFVFYRLGISNRLTFHAGHQGENSSAASIAGIAASLGQHWALETEFARQQNSSAISGIVSADYHKIDSEFRFKALRDSARNDEPSTRQHDTRWRTFWRVQPRLKLGLYGRHWSDTETAAENYLLPGVFGTVTDRFSFYARPDENGDYHLGANYHHRNHRFQAIHAVDSFSLIRHTLYDTQWRTWHFSAERSHSLVSETQLSAQLDWYPTRNYRNFIELGITLSDTRKSSYFSWNTYTRPGIDLQFQYENNSYFNGEPAQTFWLRTRLNLAKTGTKYIPTENRLQNLRLGTISGALVDSNGDRLDIDSITMRVNGKPLPGQGSNGRYAISNLKPGLYRVSVDEDDLPIELAPAKDNLVVEVKPSTVTNVDFKIEQHFGFAGFVSINGKATKNTRLYVTDTKDQSKKQVLTDDFGYYRVDELAPGQYTIHLPGNAKSALSVELSDDFLFDQNIHLIR